MVMKPQIVKLPTGLTPLAEMAIMQGRIPTDTDWKCWVLESDAVFRVDGQTITVPAGFMTDFASIPALFRWWQTGGTGPQRIAAYFHDWLYSEQSTLSRAESDRIYRLVMQVVADKRTRYLIRRWAMYLALRVGGFMAWKNNQKKLKELGPEWRMLKE
jgi:hypothetical protein